MVMNDFASIARLIENLIRFGTIVEIQMLPPRVRVITGALTTGWLPWITPRAGSDREWNPPTVNEQVILFSPSGQLGNGIVLTGLFCDYISANGDREGLHRRTYRDGAVIEYDSVSHHLNATLPDGGTTNLISQGGIHIVGPITHEGDYTQTGNQTITGKITASVDVVAANISLVKHQHGGVMSGDSITGQPQ
jgi:phage baseplate assembly protein V